MMFVDDPSLSHASSANRSLQWRLTPSSDRKSHSPFLHWPHFSSSDSKRSSAKSSHSPAPPQTAPTPPHAPQGLVTKPGSDHGGKSLDSQLWHACAGGIVQLPSVRTKVIYFPQGHGEQSASPPEFPPSLSDSASIPCRVMSVNFLADVETDEVYARIRLQPEDVLTGADDKEPALASQQTEKPTSFAKTLTQSDANNGGGFSVPRYCAETIFPRLDYSVDPPVQTVLAQDVHGEVWKFRHIYRGTPRRHLLTTGWSTFVNQKKLVAGDAIVFLRSAAGQLCVGVRRSMRNSTSGDSLFWHASLPARSSSRWEVKPSDSSFSELLSASSDATALRPTTTSSFTRNRARVTAKAVVEAATLAAAGKPFEVVYYPRASTAEFCVRMQAVKASLEHSWYAGMRFKMAFETEDSSRISWFMGTISAVQPADPIFWPNSPWRVLQVSWDEPDLLQGVSRVSPWQVELVPTLPMQLPPFQFPKKKFRVTQSPELQMTENQGFMGLTMAAITNTMLGQMNPWQNYSNDVPAGMQGARHEKSFGLTFSEYHPNILSAEFIEAFNAQQSRNMSPKGTGDCKLSNVSPYEKISAPSILLNWTGNLGTDSIPETLSSQTQNVMKKSAPFVLFGKAIDPMRTTKDDPQLSGSSSSEGASYHQFKENSPPLQQSTNSSCDGSYTDTVEPVDGHALCSEMEGAELQLHDEDHDCSRSDEIGGLKWFKEQMSMLKSEKKQVLDKLTGDGKMHCKIFLESEEIGRTVDLSTFTTYEGLYDCLANLFGVDKLKLSGRVVYKDLEGSTIHIGGEPYRNFMESVRRLTILSEPGCDATSQ